MTTKKSSLPPSSAASPPGVYVDKQTSLLLSPPSWGPAGPPAPGHGPRCHYQEEYLEEDMQTLLSDWMAYDAQGGTSSDDDDDDEEGSVSLNKSSANNNNNINASNTKGNGNSIISVTTSPLTTQRNKSSSSSPSKSKKKKWRKLHWRPPGMQKQKSSKSHNPSPNTTNAAKSPASKKSGAPPLPPSSSTSRKHHQHHTMPPKHKSNPVVIKSQPPPPYSSSGAASVAGAASVTTFRSNTSTTSIFTTKSSSTQQHSNTTKNQQRQGRQGSGRAHSPTPTMQSSVKSSTPPLARYRRISSRKRGKTGASFDTTSPGDNDRNDSPSPTMQQLQHQFPPEEYDAHPPLPPRASSSSTPPSTIREEALLQDESNDILETSSLTDDDDDEVNSLLEVDENSLVIDMVTGATIRDTSNNRNNNNNNNDVSRESNTTHVTFENMKIKVTKNYDTPPPKQKQNRVSEQMMTMTCSPNSLGDEAAAILADLGNACLLEDSSVNDNMNSPTSVMGFPDCGVRNGRINMNSGIWDNIPENDNDNPTDEDTVSTMDTHLKIRKPGPIDVDTCTRHLTSHERRNLRAMHQLGYAHLRNDELPQSLDIFAEILRGQKERHGKRSLQAAMAMHNLGVVCMRAERYRDTVRLCDGAARIRVAEGAKGKDGLDVAMSLAQMGVALMELKEYDVACKSFREALRIRKKAWRGVASGGEGEGGGGEAEEVVVNHPLIVRLLNNIGCALFEMNELVESRITFENALRMQRELMKAKKSKGSTTTAVMDSGRHRDNDDDPFDIDPRDAYHKPLSIALTLTNLGSIHLRLKEFETSLVYFEEAVLIQESVLGEEHKIVLHTTESIDFVVLSMEEQMDKQSSPSRIMNDSVKFGRIGGILPYVSYEESKRIYSKVQNELSAAMDAVNSKRCDQQFCADNETTYSMRCDELGIDDS